MIFELISKVTLIEVLRTTIYHFMVSFTFNSRLTFLPLAEIM